jgi:hypothetical protein
VILACFKVQKRAGKFKAINTYIPNGKVAWSVLLNQPHPHMNLQNLRTLLRKGQIKQALDHILAHSQQYAFAYHAEVLLISGRYYALVREEIRGTILASDRRREENAILWSLSQLADLVESEGDALGKASLPDSQVTQAIEALAAQFEETDREKMTASRLRTKNDLIRKISEQFIQKPHLVAEYLNSGQEGIIGGIAFKIKLLPCFNDLDILEALTGETCGRFVKGTITNALAEIIYSGQLGLGDDQRVRRLLDRLLEKADLPLQKNVERVRVSLEYLLGNLPNDRQEKTFYDEKVKTQYFRLKELEDKGELTPTVFIQALSALFDRGTFRFEPCLRECKTQLWQRRWVGAVETNQLITLVLEPLRPRLDIQQRRNLEDLQMALYQYYDAMGAFLFLETVDHSKLETYLQHDSFPAEKQFRSPTNLTAEMMPDEIVKAINPPLRRSIVLINELLQTVQEGAERRDLVRCEACVCEG